MRWNRNVVYRVLLVGMSVLLTCLAAEAVLRVLYAVERARGRDFESLLQRPRGQPPRDQWGQFGLGDIVQASLYDDIVYELRPSLTGRYQRAWLNVSSAGLRDREYSLKKPPDTFRIVGMGDSIMFGWKVEEPECYLSQLETQLNELPPPAPRYEVLNFAVPGYNTAIEEAIFEHKALRYEPDLCILHVVNNDWGIPKFMKKLPEPAAWRRFYFLEFINTRLGWFRMSREDPLVGHHMEGLDDYEKRDIQMNYRTMVGEKNFVRILERLAEVAREHNVKVLVATGAMYADQQRVVPATAERLGFLYMNVAAMTDQMMRERGIEPGPETYAKYLRVAKGDPHPNVFGHAIYARAIRETLEQAGVVPILPGRDTSPWQPPPDP